MAVLMLVCFYILSWEAAETADRLIDVSGNIKADQVILVDAGHGGVDSGMVGIGGLKEKGINLDIAMKLKTILEKKGLAVVMTREEDKGLYENGTKNMKAQDLQNRIEQIRKYEPVLSVSIHQKYDQISIKKRMLCPRAYAEHPGKNIDCPGQHQDSHPKRCRQDHPYPVSSFSCLTRKQTSCHFHSC